MTTHQEEIAKGFNGLLTWGNRVAAEYGIVGTQDNFAFIERTLKEQRERIAELEAENDLLKRDNDNLNSALGKCDLAGYNRLVDKLIEVKTQNAALVSQSASGTAVRMEYCWKQYDYSESEIDHANTWARAGGWTLHHIEGVAENGGYVLVVWQRPVRSEGDGEGRKVYALFRYVLAWGGGHMRRLEGLFETLEKAQAACPIPDDYTWCKSGMGWASDPGQNYQIDLAEVK
jgi:hypothetical protein